MFMSGRLPDTGYQLPASSIKALFPDMSDKDNKVIPGEQSDTGKGMRIIENFPTGYER